MSKQQMLDRYQLRSLSLAGTVALPSPFPEVGKICLQPGGVIYQGANGESAREDLVVIEHVQSNRVTIIRRVFLRDVAAAAFCPIDESTNNWHFGPEIGRVLRARSNSNNGGLMMGIAYVRETAPVLMEVQVGMTAAESAEYYPPVLERSDAHYAFHITDCHGGGGCHTKGTLYSKPCHLPREQPRPLPCHRPPAR
jgi:hypothetical protein